MWPLVNSGSQSNFSRSHEHATHRSTCTRHPNDAAVPAPYLTRLDTQSYAKTYATPSVRRWNDARHSATATANSLRPEQPAISGLFVVYAFAVHIHLQYCVPYPMMNGRHT